MSLDLTHEPLGERVRVVRRATWCDVKDVGKVEVDTHRSGRKRYRITFGRPAWNDGKRVLVSREPGSPKPFTADGAANALHDIRCELMEGKKSLQRILLPYLGRADRSDLVESRVRVWLEDFAAQVEAGQRSPGTLREYRRHAAYFTPLHGVTLDRIELRDLTRWVRWLEQEKFGAHTRRHVVDSFRSCCRYWLDLGELEKLPRFPTVRVPAYAAQVMDIAERDRVLEAIPWESRGAFLLAATEGVRLSEFCAYELAAWKSPRLRLRSSMQGRGPARRHVRHNKNLTDEWRKLWNDELVFWLDWRTKEVTSMERLQGVALFYNPIARMAGKRWNNDSIERLWKRTCAVVNVAPIPFGEATRHSTFTRLSETMPGRMVQAFSRHKDARSLAKYTKNASGPNRDAMIVALKPEGE